MQCNHSAVQPRGACVCAHMRESTRRVVQACCASTRHVQTQREKQIYGGAKGWKIRDTGEGDEPRRVFSPYRLSIAYIIRVIKVCANNPLTLKFHWDIYGCLPLYLGIDKSNIVFRRWVIMEKFWFLIVGYFVLMERYETFWTFSFHFICRVCRLGKIGSFDLLMKQLLWFYCKWAIILFS